MTRFPSSVIVKEEIEKYSSALRSLQAYVLQLRAQIWHQFIEHNCLQQASSLAFSTLLCLVPLSAVALVLLKTFGLVENEESPLIALLRENFLPRYGAEEIVSQISEFANQNLGKLSSGGFLFFLLVSTMLFMSVEQHFNDIWGARRRLPLLQAFQKYTVFYTILSLGPLLIWLLFSTSTHWLFSDLFPSVLVYCFFLLMYVALPNTFVKWSAALIGTLIAGTLFQVARLAFGHYFELAWTNYNEIYGALALLIILATWTYASWVIILLGAEVTNSVQHLRDAPTSKVEQVDEQLRYINVTGAIALFLIVAERYHRGKGACPAKDIASMSGVSTVVVEECFERFKSAGLIYEVEGDTIGYIPGQMLSDITLYQLVEVIEAGLTKQFMDVMPIEPKVTRLFKELQSMQTNAIKNITVASLLCTE